MWLFARVAEPGAAYGLASPGDAFTGTIYEGEPELDEFWLDEWRRFQSS